ncbi:hypothetical protein ABT369_39380 [Dactylosporangium sp. NPDC000244]|uniref:hypothetical protein n=1 Tax=Dactylosporangium sp. NPDC000244 TaxID=3154365 RepID=UPI00332B70D0
MTVDLNALTRYVSDERVVDLIAEAWLLLSNPDDSGGKGNEDVSGLPRGYLWEDWSKMTGRALRGFAEAHERPTTYPWMDERFDGFGWRA